MDAAAALPALELPARRAALRGLGLGGPAVCPLAAKVGRLHQLDAVVSLLTFPHSILIDWGIFFAGRVGIEGSFAIFGAERNQKLTYVRF